MAYIGKKVEETDLTNRTVDTMVGDGSDTTLTLSATPISVNNVLVFINGIMQRPTTDYTISGTTLTFGTAPFTGGIVVAITGGGEHIGVPLAKIATDKISDGAVTSAKINSLSASKITGALPALDGSALTGISIVNNITKSASDPTISSNPSSGLGTVWANTTSGETYVLTDATAGANVWTNVGPGTGDFRLSHQGTLSGYSAGSAPSSNVIEKWSFTSDANATDVSDLLVAQYAGSGSQDSTHGYIAGGISAGPQVAVNTIQRFVFATGANAISVGTLAQTRAVTAGSSSFTHGYASGGDNQPTMSTNAGINVIEKYAFASSGNGIDVGDVTSIRTSVSGVMSLTHGYVRGGRTGQPIVYKTDIEKFPFASDSNSSDLGDLISAGSNFGFNGQQSITHGYTTGGEGTGNGTRIQKHSFSSSANATSVGTLAVTNSTGAGASSTTNGYIGGGAGNNNIQKFSLSSDGNATNIADMTGTRNNQAGLSN